MRHCKHSQWLSLSSKDHEITLDVADRAKILLDYLPDPDVQRPSLLVLIGNSAKARALRELVSINGPKSDGRRAHGEIHLHIDASTTFSNRPVLIADGDLPIRGRIKPQVASAKCHETTSRVLPRRQDNAPAMNLRESVDHMYFRLLSPFTDVFCFFAVDLKGLRPIACRLASWMDRGQPSTLPKTTRPHLVVVVETNSSKPRYEATALRTLKQILRRRTRRDIFEQFADVHVVALLPHDDVSNEARHRRLKEYLLNVSDQVRWARSNTNTLFSARHFAAFFQYACTHITTTLEEPFDFIRTSRLENAVATDLKEHLSNFLLNITTPESLKRFAIPIIASSILLDNYPPGMHCKFCVRLGGRRLINL
jgi:hypothetical protein